MSGRSLVGQRHAHGCRRCHIRYEDACRTPTSDDLCTACRGGRAWQLLIDNAAVHSCCFLSARLVRKDEKATYRLAGTVLWFICTRCARTHPYDPRSTP